MPSPPSRNLANNYLISAGARKEKARKRSYGHQHRSVRPYVELHTASAFSFLNGASLPEDLVEQAAKLDLPAVALVDTNGVYGAPRFYSAARKAGLKALVGAEIVLAEARPRDGSHGDQPSGLCLVDEARQPEPSTRLTLLVENQTGYRNFCRLLTAGALGRPKGEARYSWDLIEEHSQGLHCLTGGEEGPLAHLLSSSAHSEADQLIDYLSGVFGKHLHVEVQRHHLRAEEHRNQALVEMARSRRLSIIATNGVRYARRDDKELHDILTCIRQGTTVEKSGRLLQAQRERSLKSAEEMWKLFRDLPQALDATAELGDQLDFTLANLGYRFPDYPLPEGETPQTFLRQITWNGARARFRPLTARAQAQLEKELNMIEKLDLAGYFLIVWDIVQFCQRERILVQGRGSAANSAVCYALSITAVDPVKMELLFERFLSEERGEWPDIDLDLPSGDQREKVIQHVYQTYGVHGAAMTANVITYRDRSAAREVGKALGFSPEQVDRFAKQISTWSFGEIRERADSLPGQAAEAGLQVEDVRVRHLLRLWMQIQNLPRHLGQHSGGMVMARGRLDEVVPLEPASMPGRVVIQWDKDDCADLGLIKVDLLGLGMLAAIEEAIPLIKAKEGVDVDLAHLPEEDPLVYKMLNEADTVGLFQVESRAQMASLPRHAPKVFYDIVVQVAIIRPGPIVGGMIRPFFDRRQGKVPVEYPHPCLEPILKRTLGVPLFQEQLLRIAMVAAGFSGGEAEELRRAMGFKRSMERMTDIEKRLRDGMQARGIDGAAQDQIVKSITSFALYGFPESHAASFALIAYASGYIKAHHPAAFYVALLNAWPMGFYHPATLIKDAQRHGTPALPIDVTRSGWMCRWEPAENTPDGGSIRLGLRFIKGLQEKTGRAIEEEQAREPFRNVEDLARRCRLRNDQLTRLAHAGALAPFGLGRRDALWQAAKVARRGGPLLEDVGSLEAWSEEDVRQGRHPESQRASSVETRNRSLSLTGDPSSLALVRDDTVVGDDTGSRNETIGENEYGQDDNQAMALDMVAERSPLRPMTPLQETLTDYQTMDLTAGAHLMEHYRSQLMRQNIVSAAGLKKMANGKRVTTAGAVIVRQRPGTAKGFVFLTLEDETGMSQAIVRPDLFQENRSLIVGSPGLVVEGILQNELGQPSIRAERFWPLEHFSATPSHDFH
ncbi:MAG: error-prone DNA polymerase [Acidobacteriota bacterium]